MVHLHEIINIAKSNKYSNKYITLISLIIFQ